MHALGGATEWLSSEPLGPAELPGDRTCVKMRRNAPTSAGGVGSTCGRVVYRVILFWLPLLVGAIAFISLRRGLNRPDRPELCVVPAAT
jgi:hypothetical protein